MKTNVDVTPSTSTYATKIIKQLIARSVSNIWHDAKQEWKPGNSFIFPSNDNMGANDKPSTF